jgi:hypothetical protein
MSTLGKKLSGLVRTNPELSMLSWGRAEDPRYIVLVDNLFAVDVIGV